jgi:glutaminyl-tRNA synthetase
MGVLRPIKLIIENYPDGQVEQLDYTINPEDASAGTRQVPFTKELYIERDDFLQKPPKGYKRLSPGVEVRLRYAYLVTCTGARIDEQTGDVQEVYCRYDPATRGGNAPDGRKVQGTIHWVSAPHAIDAEVRLYDHLFRVPEPDKVPEGAGEDAWLGNLNPISLEVLTGCKLESHLGTAAAGSRFQLERQGYFCADSKDSRPGAVVLNRVVGLRDTWGKVQQGGKKK